MSIDSSVICQRSRMARLIRERTKLSGDWRIAPSRSGRRTSADCRSAMPESLKRDSLVGFGQFIALRFRFAVTSFRRAEGHLGVRPVAALLAHLQDVGRDVLP